MKKWLAIAFIAASGFLHAAEMARPKAGKVEIFPLKDIRAGMQATAWTVFQGTEPEAVPIEIIGVWNKANGPNDVILGKMGGKAKETNVAAGMSGSPVYIDGKLVGAVALRISVFSPDSICGITPIESMLEINDFDASRPADARTPGATAPSKTVAAAEMPNDLLARLVAAGVGVSGLPQHAPLLTPIETPLIFSGFSEKTMRAFDPMFSQMGITPVQGGGGAAGNLSAKPVAGWEKSLNPGDSVAGILVSGDLSVTGTGTVTYNDGKRILAFGHPFMSLGPVDMPMAKSDVVMTLASSYQPTKLPNTTDVVGALHQDRFSGIMGELGDEAPTVPVHFKVRTLDASNAVVKEKDMNFSIFVHQKWTPYLMLLTLSTSLQQINEFADEITYRMTGNVQMADGSSVHAATMLAGSEASAAAPPMVLATWWADKFNRLFLNPVSMPKLKSVDCTIDLMPDRHVAAIDNAWTPSTEVEAGSDDSRESLPAPLSRRAHGNVGHREDSRGHAQGRAPHPVQRRGHSEPPANHRRRRRPLSGHSGDGVAAQSGAQQQPDVRFIGGRPRHVLHRRQDAAVLTRLHAERVADGSHAQPVPGRDHGHRAGTALGAVR